MKALAKAKKLKRFEDGGEVDAATMDAGTKELERIRDENAAAEESAAPEYKSFKEAFAANRKSGAKTFEYNGKKYTTDLAPARKEVAKPTAATVRKADIAAAPKGRGVIDTSNINPNTLLPRRANGGVVARATVKSHGKAC